MGQASRGWCGFVSDSLRGEVDGPGRGWAGLAGGRPVLRRDADATELAADVGVVGGPCGRRGHGVVGGRFGRRGYRGGWWTVWAARISGWLAARPPDRWRAGWTARPRDRWRAGWAVRVWGQLVDGADVRRLAGMGEVARRCCGSRRRTAVRRAGWSIPAHRPARCSSAEHRRAGRRRAEQRRAGRRRAERPRVERCRGRAAQGGAMPGRAMWGGERPAVSRIHRTNRVPSVPFPPRPIPPPNPVPSGR